MNSRLSFGRLLTLNAGWLGLGFMWNALHPLVLPALLVDFVPDASKNTYLGLLTFAGLVLAMVIQPLAGGATDTWRSRFGRRRPLIAIGTVLAILFLALLARGGGLIWLIMGYVGLQISSNLAQGPLQALLRDRVPEPQLGTASSVKILMDVATLAAASLVTTRFMGVGSAGSSAMILVIAAVLATSFLLTILGTPEVSTEGRNPVMRSGVSGSSFSTAFRESPAFAWLIVQRILFLLGVYGLQAFAEYYIHDVLGVANAVQQTGQLLAAIAGGVLVLVLVGGWLTDRFGAKPILYVAAGTTAAGLMLFLLITSAKGLPMPGAILGAGIGLFLTANWTLANRLAPPEHAGRYLGLTNLATAGAAAIVRLQGPAIDWLNAAHPLAWMGYRALYLFSGLCIMLSAVVLTRIPSRA